MRRIFAGVLIALLAACDGEIGPSTTTGTYTLRTINGSKLPVVISGSGNDKTEVLDDTIILYEGGTYAETAHNRVTVAGQASTVTRTEAGSWVTLGTSITMTPAGTSTQRIGQVQGYDMIFIVAGQTSVFTK